MLNIIKKTENDSMIVSLEGRLDTNTASQLEAELKAPTASCLILDLEKLDYISSAGLRVLLSAQKRMAQGSMKLIHVQGAVMEIFEITGFTDIFDIE